MLDEPAGGLNHEEVAALMELLRHIREELKLTVLLVEHHMNLVMRISDQVVALNFGRKIADGMTEVQNGQVIKGLSGDGSMSDVLLQVRGLHAAYGPTKVLHGLDFDVKTGGITTILGANGAGKTTTLRAVCAMVKTQGEVLLGGERIDGKATESIVRLGVAHVPDGRGTFLNFTVEENLALGAYTRKDRARNGAGL